MKIYQQTDEDLALEIEQVELELAALEISVRRKKLRLKELRANSSPSPTGTPIGVKDCHQKPLYIGDRVIVQSTSKNKSFIKGKTEAVITGITPTKQVNITDVTRPLNTTWRDSGNLEKLFEKKV